MDTLHTKSRSMRDDKVQVAIEVVARALDISAEDLNPDSSMDNTPLWDSMGHLTVCMEFERRFGKSLDLNKILETSSVRDLAALVP